MWLAPTIHAAQLHVNLTGKSDVSIYIKEKDLISTDLLRKCDKTALLAPFTRVIEMERLLRNSYASKISVGKEVLLEQMLRFYLIGWVPTFIQRRIRGIQTSGILEWWNKFVAVHLANVRATSRERFAYRNKGTAISEEMNRKILQTESKNLMAIIFAMVIPYFLGFICYLIELLYIQY